MKKIILLIIFAYINTTAFSQNLILNGSFENNIATGNTFNLTTNWPVTVADCFEVDGGSMDLITSNNCGIASDGNWYVTCSPQVGAWPYLAFSFKLSDTLTTGAQYTLTFDKRFCGPNSSPIEIGVTGDSIAIGTTVHSSTAPTLNTWSNESIVFQAPLPGRYLSINVGTLGTTGTVGLDNFILQAGNPGINEFTNDNLKLYPNPVNGIFNIELINASDKSVEIYDMMGIIVYHSTINSILTKIDLSSFASGLYVVKIYDNKNYLVSTLIKE